MSVDTLNARWVLRFARTNIGRVPTRSGATGTDTDVLEGEARTISDARMLRWVYQAEQAIAREAKGMYLKPLIGTHDGVLSAVPNGSILRPLDGWVFRSDGGTYHRCRFRTASEHTYMESAGRAATATNPAYTFNSGELEVYPQGSDPTILVFYVGYPARLTPSDLPSSPYYKSVSTDALTVPTLFAGPVGAFVTAKASRALENPGAQTVWSQLAGRFMDPFRRSFRVGRPAEYQADGGRIDDREVNVEV